jgi:hypothetical protein
MKEVVVVCLPDRNDDPRHHVVDGPSSQTPPLGRHQIDYVADGQK